MPKPGSFNFPDTLKGDTFEGVEFTLENNGSPVDLTGSSIEMMVKLVATGTSALTVSTPSSGLTITDASNGVFEFDEQIISIDAGQYVYDIEVTDVSGDVLTYVSGTWLICQDVTFTP
jgi:hypothetical protein